MVFATSKPHGIFLECKIRNRDIGRYDNYQSDNNNNNNNNNNDSNKKNNNHNNNNNRNKNNDKNNNKNNNNASSDKHFKEMQDELYGNMHNNKKVKSEQ